MPQVECDIFDTFDMFQNYYDGFTFGWLLKKEAVVKKPISFVVQQSPTGLSDWKDISDPVVDGSTWAEECKNRSNKNNNLFYRIRAVDADGKTCYSPVKTAFGDQELRSYALTKEIMRRELLQMRGLAGVTVNVYKKVHGGELCSICRDAITGQVMDPTCEECGGTGFIESGGWYGPFPTFGTFSVRKIHKKHSQDADFVEDDRLHHIRLVGTPILVRDDMIVDTTNNLRYTVNVIDNLTEIRRIAVVQDLTANEIETTDVKYSVGV